MSILHGKKNRIILTAIVLLITVFVSAVVSFSLDTEFEYTKSQVELLYDELLVRDDRLIDSDTYFVTGEYISRIRPNTSVEEFTNNLNRNDFTLLEGGKEVKDGIVKTGMELVRGDEFYTLVVAGDLNKDGLMNYVDTSMMINNTKTLTDDGIIRVANDFNEDTKYDKTDVLNSVDYILNKKLELKEVNIVKAPVIEFVSGDVGERDWYLGDIKLKLTATEDLEIGYKIVGTIDQFGVVEDDYEITLSGYGAYKVIAWHIGEDGSRSDTTSLVYKIDDREIEASITYSSTEIGSERVIAAISFNKENVFITNNDGRYTHTFYGNGDFQFQYKDLTGRVGRAQAMVSWVTDSVGEDGMWRYSVLNDNEIYLREYVDSEYRIDDLFGITIPAEYEGFKVVGVGNNVVGMNVFGTEAFCPVAYLEIEDGVEEIGEYAFKSCGNGGAGILSGISIPDSVTSIGASAFEGVVVPNGNLTISNSVKEISEYAFAGSKFYTSELVIPESVEVIKDNAFIDSLFIGGLEIPGNVVEIGDSAFNGVGFTGELVISDGVKKIGSIAFANNEFTGGLIIPNSVTTMGYAAFSESGFNGTLTLSNSLTTIENTMFWGSGFTGELVIPDSVVTIEDDAFSYGDWNGTLTLGKNLVTIGNYAFSDNNFIGNLVIPDSVENIGSYAFSEAGFDGALILGNGLTKLEGAAFYNTGLTGDLVIPDSVTHIYSSVFADSLFSGTLTLGNNLEYIGTYVFRGLNFQGDLVIPEKVNEIDKFAFSNNSFDGRLVLNGNLEKIGEQAFINNSFVGDLLIPSSVESIGFNAFEYAGFTGDLIVNSDVENMEDGIFGYTGFTGNLSIGDEVTSLDWITNSGLNLSSLSGSLVIGNGITEISSFLFENSGFTGDLFLGDRITTIGTDAFAGISFAGSLVIGDGISDLNILTDAGLYLNSFYGNLEIGDGITEIPVNYFENSNFTGTLTLGKNIKNIQENAFALSSFTGDLIIPESVVYVGDSAFYSSGFNGTFSILGTNVRILSYAFGGNPNLTGTVDAKQFTYLDETAFEATPNITIINN